MSMNYDFAADNLSKTAEILKSYDCIELQCRASMLIFIAAELRKLAPRQASTLPGDGLKPTPPRIDPNSKIPRPVAPPKGSGPVKLAMNGVGQ